MPSENASTPNNVLRSNNLYSFLEILFGPPRSFRWMFIFRLLSRMGCGYPSSSMSIVSDTIRIFVVFLFVAFSSLSARVVRLAFIFLPFRGIESRFTPSTSPSFCSPHMPIFPFSPTVCHFPLEIVANLRIFLYFCASILQGAPTVSRRSTDGQPTVKANVTILSGYFRPEK